MQHDLMVSMKKLSPNGPGGSLITSHGWRVKLFFGRTGWSMISAMTALPLLIVLTVSGRDKSCTMKEDAGCQTNASTLSRRRSEAPHYATRLQSLFSPQILFGLLVRPPPYYYPSSHDDLLLLRPLTIPPLPLCHNKDHSYQEYWMIFLSSVPVGLRMH